MMIFVLVQYLQVHLRITLQTLIMNKIVLRIRLKISLKKVAYLSVILLAISSLSCSGKGRHSETRVTPSNEEL